MEIFAKRKIYNFMGASPFLAAVSLIFVVASVILLFTRGLNYGVDFQGGTLVQIKYNKPAPIEQIREIIGSKDEIFKDALITEFGSNEEVIIKFQTSSDNLGTDIGDEITKLLKDTGELEVRRVDIVGPKVGSELRVKGAMALGFSLLATLIYLAIRFEWRFGIASIVALVHDVVITLGALSLFKIDINLDILAAILTLIGYSLNDTIIIFDRIREQIIETKDENLSDIVNESVSLTLPRTILTSLVVFFVILTLFIFGGDIIYGFSFSLLVGSIVGTYSSTFTAAPSLKLLGFDVQGYRAALAKKEKARIEKEKARAMYEKGII